MEHIKYLNKLEFWLSMRLRKNEVQDILSDYEAYFDEGFSEGRTATEMMTALGSARVVAKSMDQKSFPLAPVFKVLRGIILVLLLFMAYDIVFDKYENFLVLDSTYSILLILLVPMAIHFILNGMSILSYKWGKLEKRYWPYKIGLTALIFASIFLIRYVLVFILHGGTVSNELIAFIGYYLEVMTFMMVGLLAWFIRYINNGKYRLFGGNFLILGALFSINSTYMSLRFLDDASSFYYVSLTWFFPLIIGFMMMLVTDKVIERYVR